MDLSQLSDDELRKLYAQPSLAHIPDDELKAMYKQSAPKAEDNLGGTLPFFGMDTGIPIPKALEAGLVSAGKTTTRIGQGVQSGVDWLRGKDNPKLDAKVADENRLFAPLEQQYPVSTALGSALPSMAVPVGMAGSVAGALGRSALAGAVPGALEYGSLEDRAKRTALGAAGGVAGGALGIGAGRVLNPIRGAGPEAIDAITGAAKQFDIPLTAGQATGSKPLQYFESALANLPGSSSRMATVGRAQQDAVNKAAAKIMGQDASVVTPEVVQGAKKAAGGQIESLTSAVDVPLTEKLVTDLASVETRYMQRLPSQQRPVVQRYIDEILSHDGAIPGAVYQGTRADLGAEIQGASKGSLKNALAGIQKALDDAFSTAADGGTNASLKAARQKYADASTLKKLATATGDISGPRIANAAKESRGQLGELAALMGKIKPLPDSGTAQRSFWMNALTKNPLELLAPANILGATGLPYAAATAVTRAPFKQYLTRGALPIDPEIEKLLIKYGGLLGVAGANGGSRP